MGIGTNCPTHGGAGAEVGNLVYMWRWAGEVSHDTLGEEGESKMVVSTCHVQCTCTPHPPACDFSECADEFCTYCSGGPAPPTPGLEPTTPEENVDTEVRCVCSNSGVSSQYLCNDDVVRDCPDGSFCHNPFLGYFLYVNREDVCLSEKDEPDPNVRLDSRF
jgi:hypothetical protein